MKLIKTFKQSAAVLALSCLSVVAAGTAQAADFPTRPINLVVPFKAGGGTDAYARAVAAGAKDVIDVPVVVINKPGAGGPERCTERSDGTAGRLHPDAHLRRLLPAENHA